MNDLPEMAAATFPFLPEAAVKRVAGKYVSFRCRPRLSVPVLVLHHHQRAGPQVAHRTPDDVEAIIRANWAQDITRFFVTDDNFARNRNWEPILDRLIQLRERDGFRIRLLLQVDTLCHRIPGFIEKAARAGCTAVFIGLENINPESLLGTKKRQNKIWEYREMLQGLETGQGHHLRRLHPRFPDRHAGNDCARHRDHQGRVADRHPRVLLPDAPAGLGGSEEALSQRGADGPRHEQIRCRACLHRASAHVEGGMGSRPIATPGRASIPTSTSRPCSSAPMSTGSR
jgi:hypothetical protein